MSKTRLNHRTEVSEPPNQNACSECGSELVEERSEVYCTECGLVEEVRNLDRGPEWRAFDFQEEQKKSRTGAPTVPYLHDRGMSTKVGGSGDKVNSKVRRLRKWQTRVTMGNGKERGLQKMMKEIYRMVSCLELPKHVHEGAANIARKASSEDLIKGRSYEAVASASLIFASRIGGTPVTQSQVAEVSQVEEIRIQRTYRKLQRSLDIGVPPTHPEDYIDPFLEDLRKYIQEEDDYSEFKSCVENVVSDAVEANLHSSRDPKSISSAAVYHVAKKRGIASGVITQNRVANAFDVTHVTIRERYQEIEEVRR